jgi:peroxiredoxin
MAQRVSLNEAAPEFALDDYEGRPVRLADYRGERHVVLVLNRGFL